MVKDVNISTSLILSYLYSTVTVYTSSVLRPASPFWLKINYSCYFCPCVSNSIIPSSLPTSAFIHHFVPVFYPSCLFGFLPISFTCCFDSLYLLGFGLCSVRSSSNHSCTASVFNTCKGNLSLNEVYTGSLFMQALGENEAADSFLQWTLQKSAKGNF